MTKETMIPWSDEPLHSFYYPSNGNIGSSMTRDLGFFRFNTATLSLNNAVIPFPGQTRYHQATRSPDESFVSDFDDTNTARFYTLPLTHASTQPYALPVG